MVIFGKTRQISCVLVLSFSCSMTTFLSELKFELGLIKLGISDRVCLPTSTALNACLVEQYYEFLLKLNTDHYNLQKSFLTLSFFNIFQSDHFVLSTNFLFKFNVSLLLVTGELLQNTVDVNNVTYKLYNIKLQRLPVLLNTKNYLFITD